MVYGLMVVFRCFGETVEYMKYLLQHFPEYGHGFGIPGRGSTWIRHFSVQIPCCILFLPSVMMQGSPRKIYK